MYFLLDLIINIIVFINCLLIMSTTISEKTLVNKIINGICISGMSIFGIGIFVSDPMGMYGYVFITFLIVVCIALLSGFFMIIVKKIGESIWIDSLKLVLSIINLCVYLTYIILTFVV